MHKHYLKFFLVSCFCFVYSQEKKLDQILLELKTAKHDTVRYVAFMNLGNYFQSSNPDTAYYFYTQAEKTTEKIPFPEGLLKKCDALRQKGWCAFLKGDFDAALDQFKSCIKLLEKHTTSSDSNIKKISRITLSAVLSNLATLYTSRGYYDLALEYYFKSQKIYEEFSNKKGQAANLSNIGIIYYNQNYYDRTLNYFFKALRLGTEIGDKYTQIGNLGNIGLAYYSLKDYNKALDYFSKAFYISKEVDDKRGQATNLANIANIYADQGNYSKALIYFEMAQKLDTEIENKQGQAINLTSIGCVYATQKNYKKAEALLKKAEQILQETHDVYYLRSVYDNLSTIYNKTGRFKEALYYYKEMIKARDSIQNEEKRKATVIKEMKYNYEKEKALKEKEHQEQLAIEKEKQEKQKLVTRFIIAGLILVVLFTGFIVNRLQVTRKQKQLIEKQKQIVEEQKKVVEEQKLIVEQKNKDITDSIKYSKRIQDAILPHPQKWKEHLPDSFILYLPKDIVAGDFYWMEALDNYIFVAAADCTGHGVPGAMVSVVCSNALTKAVLEEKILNTDEILNRVREIVIEKLTSEENIRDGMDICLVRLTKYGNEIQYSGANRPLCVVQDGVFTEYKPDKQPVGRYEKTFPFSKQDIILQKNSMLYLTTDGYADQFGGEKGKKIGTKTFKDLLIKKSALPNCENQKNELAEYFHKWKGREEQMDDVTVIGIKTI